MLKTVKVALVAAALIILAPASIAGASASLKIPRVLRPALPGTHSVTVQMHAAGTRFAAYRRLAARNVALTARLASLRHHAAPAHHKQRLTGWSPGRLRADNARLARAIKQLTTPAPVSATSGPNPQNGAGANAAPAGLAAIAQCESGGNPSAVGGGGTYRGLYQFDQQTWQSVGGTGDPAAASPAEQTQRAAALYAQSGTSSWPVCGK